MEEILEYCCFNPTLTSVISFVSFTAIEVGDKKNAATIEDKISGRFGFTYTFTQDNGNRIQVKADSFQFLIDAEKKQAYPQFKPLTKPKPSNVSATFFAASYP